jgi:acetylornithine deacetylase/succinyl-diaminopimelate desuccinylase-like protein
MSTPDLDTRITELAQKYLPDAIDLLRAVIRVPADHVDRPESEGGDPSCGLSNHEHPRLEVLRERIIAMGAVESPEDVGYDEFGNLVWTVCDPDDGVAPEDKTVIYLDGHTDTVKALRDRWLQAIGGGIDAYDGLTDEGKVDRDFLRNELGHVPPDDEWQHLVFGRGSADQLGGVVCQVLATRIARELRSEGALHGVIMRSYGTVTEEDNDGGGPMYVMRKELPGAGIDRVPDVVILSEGTGCNQDGAVGIYRGQRGRMQIELEVTGKRSSAAPSSPRRPRSTTAARASSTTSSSATAPARRAGPSSTRPATARSPSAGRCASTAGSPLVRPPTMPSPPSRGCRPWLVRARPASRSMSASPPMTSRPGRAMSPATRRSIRAG